MFLKRKSCPLASKPWDQVHVVKQGVLGLHLDSSSHKLKKPKKLTSRWSVLTRCEKTGQHTLHVCKTDSPDSSVKDSFPVQTSWSIKSAHCLKSAQRMDIFKEEGFIIHMGRQVAYISSSSRTEVKSWMCAILEGVTLGFEYHCKVGEHKSLGIAGECMLVLTPECIALLCPLTGAPLRKWPFFLLTGCSVVDDTVYWITSECDLPFKATVNQHNIFTLYNVLCRYLSHTNSNVQPDISISKPETSRKARVQSPAENKYTVREMPLQSPPAATSPQGLCTNQLYLSQETCSEKMNYELLSSNHSDYSTGVSSTGSTYDSDVYELMENSGAPGHTTDCIYEDMTSTSPLTDEGYMTSSGSNSSRFRFSSAGRSAAVRPIPLSVYMNMDGKSRDQEATLVPDTSARGLSRETSRDEDATLRPPCYEYIDIELPDRGLLSPVAPPCLPSRNKKPSKPDIYTTSTPQEATRNPSGESRDKQLSEGLKSYQEQSRLQKEVMMNFSASVLESNSRNDSCHSRAFMNSAV